MIIKKKAILPRGFTAAAVSCGIKRSGKPDCALFHSQAPAIAAAMFTTNKVVAAPVMVCRELLKKGTRFHAIVANSGNANCFTGERGMEDARRMGRAAAAALGVPAGSVFVASTGIIGKRLPSEKVEAAMPQLASLLSPEGVDQAKRAIMTTDKFSKDVTATVRIGASTVTITGVAKGAGMIAPDMATLLSFVFTDASISPGALSQALKGAVELSYNRITVDGCMSTNDTVICLANGAAGNRKITGGKELRLFREALEQVNLALAKMMVRDGEGASKFIAITVKGAVSEADAKKACLMVANSNLFKTAVYGENPNFGRIAAAVGASGCAMKQEKLRVHLGPLSGTDVRVDVDLGLGKGSCTVYTSDLTPEYIKINAEYN